MSPGVPRMGYTYLNLLGSPGLLQILVILTAVMKPLMPNFGRAIVILNFVRRFRNFIADTVSWQKNIASVIKTLLQQGISEPEFYGD